MTDAIERFVEHVVDTKSRAIPPEARAATRRFLLDTLGVGVAGSAGPFVEELLASQREVHGGDRATVWVHGERLSAAGAALVNGYQIHNAEFDCVHERAVVHTMTVPTAAALAYAEAHPAVSGRALSDALTLGVDVACHVSVACREGLRFFRPATAGALGAVAAIGRLAGFDRETLLNAFGAVHAQLSGTMQAHTEGSAILAMQIGFNARNALVACDLAARGLVAPHAVLEGTFGYFALFEGRHDLASVLPEVGQIWRITEVAHKPFPSGRATHGVVDACLTLMREHGFEAGAVRSVTARVPPLVHHLVGRPPHREMIPNYARLCVAYVAACALRRGTVSVRDFSPDARTDPTTLDLAARVQVEVDHNPDPNALTPVSVRIELDDGHRHDLTVSEVYGSPAKPMTRAAELEKLATNFDSAARPLTPAQRERLIEQVDRLDEVADVRELVECLV